MPEPRGPATRFVASRDGVPIAYTTQGTGKRALVFIHGWSCDKSYWAPQIAALSQAFRIIALDLGGHGESGTGRAAWTVSSFGQDVAAVVEATGSGPVVLVGHSMGGNVAVAAARLIAKRTEAVVWVDTYRKLGSPRSAEEIQELLAPFRENFQARTDSYVRGMFGPRAGEALVQMVAERMAAAPPAIAVPALESSLSFGRTITETLGEIDAPIVAINAAAPLADVQSMQRYGVEVVTMPDVGHFPMMESPQSFNGALEAVLERVLGAGADAG
jgi:pimeloyl-ACP methyl ester carboxylesterase